MSIENTEDLIDVRDVIARVEELDSERDDNDKLPAEEEQEFSDLYDLLSELRGCGGDYQWQGDWFPITLIRDTYFAEYARELAEGIGAINKDAVWPNNCIDWERAARELQHDYSEVEYLGVTYWYR